MVAFLHIRKRRIKGHIAKSLNTSLFLIKMPKYETAEGDKKQQEQKAFIQSMEQFYTNFLDLNKSRSFSEKLFYGDLTIALEIASISGEEGISFYVGIPKHLEAALEKYVTGIFAKAVVKKVSKDYTIFGKNSYISAEYLKLKKADFVSITTYEELEKDPLSQITNSLSKTKENEGAAIQLIIKPSSKPGAKRRADKIISKMEKGQSLDRAIDEVNRSPFIKILVDTLDLLIRGPKKDRESEETKDIVADKKVIEGIQKKIKKRVFDVNIRIVTSAQSKERANEMLKHIESSFNQFSLTLYNAFKSKEAKHKKLKKLIYNYSFRLFDPSWRIVLNTEELASIFHFPMVGTETPHLGKEKSLSVAPPEDLPKDGVVLLGKTSFRGEEKKVYYATAIDRRRHLYVVGQTGTGKSSFLTGLIRQDIHNNKGVCVIDPHGDLIEDTLAIIPENRIKDVVLFEPFRTERPMGLNMLEADTPEDRDFAVQEMISIFFKLFEAETMGPMFEHYMRHAMLTLMANKEQPGTLVEIARVFTDDDYVKKYLKHVTDPILQHFWYGEWLKMPQNTRADMTGYLVSKLGRFVENEMMRNIIGQSHSGIDFAEIMNGEKILLANLSKGLTGEVNSSLLGLILVSKFQMTAMKRASIPEHLRKDFYLYLDEFQNFTTDSISSILSEARKYKLNLILAHQYSAQLTDDIKNSVFGNVGSMGAFRVGIDDAEILEKQFAPEFTKFDLTNIDNYKLILRLMINNKISSPFVLNTIPPAPFPSNSSEIIEKSRKMSQLQYTRPKALVERDIMRRMNIG